MPDEATNATDEAIEQIASASAPVGSEATSAPAEVSGTEAAVAVPESWLTDEYKELASSYGIGDDQLKEFSSAAEFNRTATLLDRQLSDFAKRQVQEVAAPEDRPAQQAIAQAAPTNGQTTQQQVANAQQFGKVEKLDIDKLKAEGYDDDSLKLFAKQNEAIDRHNALVDHLEKKAVQEKAFEERFGKLEKTFGQFEQMIVQAENQRRLNTFHSTVDSLGDDRYGKTATDDGRPMQLTVQQNEARAKLFETAGELMDAIALRQQNAGQPVQLPPLNVMLKRANQLAFAEDIRAQERQRVQAELAEQAKRRRPVATARGPNGQFTTPDKHVPLTSAEYVQSIVNNPEVDAAWNKALESAGAV